MTIVLYTRNLKGRGVQKIYLNLAKAFQELGYTVHFVISEIDIDFDYSFIENFYQFEDNHIQKLDGLIGSLGECILITSDAKSANRLHNIGGKNLYFTVHMLWSTRIFKRFRVKKFFELLGTYKNKNIFFASIAVQKDFVEKMRIIPSFKSVLYDAIDIESIKERSRERVDINFPYIINLGALSREKNHQLLIRTYAKLQLDEHLIILGEGKLRPKLEKLIQKLHIEHKVHLLGWKKNPYPYIRQASLFVSTLDNEALHGSVIESLVVGTPVVSTDSVGVREVLVAELSRYIVKNNRVLGAAIQSALNQYTSINEKYFNKFDYIRVAKQYLEVIQNNREFR